jgi:pimeloyl-ACP methyl ester carboxylesterase
LDLQVVISQVVTAKSFHLLGHSYGGSLAYDYIAYRAMHPSSLPECKSLILSNAAKSMSVVHSEYDRFWKKNPKTFWNEHVCRAGTPALLEDALQHVGRIWGGMDVVLDYVAQSVDDQTAIPSTLVVTGIHDFGYIGSNEEAWKPIIPNLASASLERCAHYPFYEDGETYGRILEDFFEQTERTC